MRRSILIAASSFSVGLSLASATAWGYAKLNAWRAQGESFQLGYVVGYLDGVEICKSHDLRVVIPSRGRPQYERWRDGVNEYFADPTNADRQVPDAMKWIGDKIQKEQLEALNERFRNRGTPSPSGTGAATATPAAP